MDVCVAHLSSHDVCLLIIIDDVIGDDEDDDDVGKVR